MRRYRAVVLCALAVLSCKKEAPGDRPREQRPLPAAPPLFAHIPADTPYVFAAFEPTPRAYWDRMATLRGDIEKAIDAAMREPPVTSEEKLGHALLRTVRESLSAEGFKKNFGISPDARFAIYGVGLLPVLRVELADPKALTATIERLSKESGLTLPTATAGGRGYYRFEHQGALVVLAVADDQLIVGGGPTAMVDKALPLVLGLQKPSAGMSDGGALKKVIEENRFGPWAGYLDTRRLLAILAAVNFFRDGEPLPASCQPELDALGARFPRVVMGYDEWSATKIVGRMLVETDPATAARLKQLVVEGPARPEGRPLLSFGAAVDLGKARALAQDFADGVARIGTACGAPDVAEAGSGMRAALAQPLPPGLDKVRAGLVTVLSAKMAHDGPTDVQAYAILASDDPQALLKQLPVPGLDKLAPDGKFHEVMPAGGVPGLGPIQAALKNKALVAAVGARAVDAAEAALARTGKAPLFQFAYDYGEFMRLVTQLAPPSDDPTTAFTSKMATLFGLFSMWAVPTDRGLEFGTSMEVR